MGKDQSGLVRYLMWPAGNFGYIIQVECVGGWIERQKGDELVAVVSSECGDEAGERTFGSLLVVGRGWNFGRRYCCHLVSMLFS